MKRKKSFFLAVLMSLFLSPFLIAQTGSSLTISEIMFNPSESNGEFIELYNTSKTETINLTGYQIKYYTSNADNFVAFVGGMELGPGKYAVIIESDYDYNNGVYKNLIPADALVIKISDASFGTSGMANTTSRDVSLLNNSGQVIETYTYSADNSAGISDEKFLLTKDNSASNWRNSVRTNGTPGTINSVTPVNYLNNLTVRLNKINPTNPVQRDTVKVGFIIKNNGEFDANSFSVDIFKDANGDSLKQTSEVLVSKSFSDLSSKDSVFIETKFYADKIEQALIVAVVNYSIDEKPSDNTAYVIVPVSEKPAQYSEIVINEIMYAPANDEPEWIELYNRSDREINLKNWKIFDTQSSATISATDYNLNAGEYLVIGSDEIIRNYYTHQIKLIVKQLPSLNNTGDEITLKNGAGTTIDSVKYFPEWGGNTSGKSLERISVNSATNNSTNWKTSESKYNATPSLINSVTGKQKDLSVKSISSPNLYAEIGKQIILNVEVVNKGAVLASSYTLKLYNDKNLDGINDETELLTQTLSSNLPIGQTKSFSFVVSDLKTGINKIVALIDYAGDEYTENNSITFEISAVTINEVRNDLIVNEIMFAPTNAEPEWIELYNKSNKQINLKGYQIQTNSSKNVVVTKNIIINPDEYFIVTKDSSMFLKYPKPAKFVTALFSSLNNLADRVIVLDSLNRTIDSLNYKSSWGGINGKSLERLAAESATNDSLNWKSSASQLGATPGYINSISQKKFDLKINFTSALPKYLERGKAFSFTFSVSNLGNNSIPVYSIGLYKDINKNNIIEDNEKIDQIQSSNILAGQTKDFNLSTSNLDLGINRFFIRTETALDEYTDNNTASFEINVVEINEIKGDLIVNEIMYAPFSEPEWIEIYNNSNKTINIKGYQLSNSSSKAKIVNKNLMLVPEEYYIIAKDSSIFSKYPTLTKATIVSFPALTNIKEKIVLSDSLDRTIDSLYYKDTWGGSNGKSLERIEFSKSSIDSTNWKTSYNNLGATPGFVNSVSQKKFDVSTSSISFTPNSPMAGNKVKISCVTSNTGKTNAAFKLILYKVNIDGSKQKLEESNSLSLASTENLKYDFNYTIEQIFTKYQFEVYAEFIGDEDVSNNSITEIIRPGYEKNSVLINEIMYAPLNGEPEWVELYNNTNIEIDLDEWSLSDVLPAPSNIKIKTIDFLFQPKSYLIIAKDSTIIEFHKSIPAKIIYQSFAPLNNDADGLSIHDSKSSTIDSMKYDKSFGGENGKTLERILFDESSTAKSNWGSSKDIELGSPGKINSLSPKDYDIALTQFICNQKYAVVGKKIKLSFSILNPGKKTATDFNIKLYLDNNKNNTAEPGELIFQKNEKSLLPDNSLSYEVDDASYIIGQNKYIVLIDYSLDQSEDNNKLELNLNAVVINEERNDLVINEIMYAPSSAEPEWIEIYNNSLKNINLKGYQLANTGSKTKCIATDFVLKPEEYYVIAHDSTIFSKYPSLTKISVANFPSFNNTKDRVMLLDSLDRTIDSLIYKNTWGGTAGKSLERILASGSSVDSTNWKTCADLKGATPCLVNSNSKKKFDLAVTNLTFDPAQPLAGTNVKIIAALANIGKNDAVFKLTLYKVNNDSSKQKLEETNNLILSANATLNYQFSYSINSISVKNKLQVVAEFTSDENLTNNIYSSTVLPGYKQGSVLINEVMYNPLNGEPEWIELFNNTGAAIDIESWTITDIFTTPQKQIIKTDNTIIPANSLFVISKDSTVKNFHKEISSRLIVSAFANLNNDADGIVIKDSRGVTLDSMQYDNKWGGENGKSLERKQLIISSTEKTNWGSSKDTELSTPGRINSLAVKKFDLCIKSIIPSPKYPVLNQETSIGAKVINYGTSLAANFLIKYYYKNNSSYVLFNENTIQNLAAGDSSIFYSTYKIKLEDIKTVLCKVYFTTDEDTLNNSLSVDIVPGAKQNAVLITEVMYDPLKSEPEWIEFYNASTEAVNLKDWAVSDLLPSPTKGKISLTDSYLQPGSFAIATSDTNTYAFNPPKNFYQVKFGTLGNTSDAVLIYDFRGAVIDSFYYKAAWGGGDGASLERISLIKATNDSTNWVTSISHNGASPGIVNSTSTAVKYEHGSLIINEILYEPASGNPEFVELYNSSKDSIQVGGMELKIGDKDKSKLSATSFIVPPKEYFILASDSTIYNTYSWLKNFSYVKISKELSLSNSGTKLFVKDLKGTTLDSLEYSPAWHNKNFLDTKNKSLERINPNINSNDKSNWSSCVTTEGATPGKANSIYTENLAGSAKVSINPNPFSPDGDGFEDFAIINFSLPYKISQVNIKVFDNQGRLVRSILENRPSSSNNSIVFDGLDDNGKALRIGIYILLIEVVADGSYNKETIKTPIVIARKL